ncbi:class I SAM-dependent methyltransferase [Kineosporia sp. A_224]|uniref:class I SAM-dependent methyltransferase n=1 Tax=Kineosporia sp. A_224 TaxID=1962180 RepID=UPI0018E975B9|nr:class I SAM-dependent methyltransferase [Kineosporia sp. A_224]
MSTKTTQQSTYHVGDDADRALKARHATMWALGDFPSVAHRVIPHLGADLVEAAGVRAGQHVLDVGAGAGNAAIPAAVRGATVVASDIAPVLLDAGRAEAQAFGDDVAARLDWQVADAEALPHGDGEFDVVLSSVGVMFAPHHPDAAAELLRVTRPGGTIALANWTPQGFVGRLFATMKPFAAPPPPGAQPPPLWGDEDHVRSLLGAGTTALHLERRQVLVEGFTSGAQWRDLFKAAYGPTVAAYAALADRPDDVAALDAALAALGDDALADGVMEWEYLLVVAERGR